VITDAKFYKVFVTSKAQERKPWRGIIEQAKTDTVELGKKKKKKK